MIMLAMSHHQNPRPPAPNGRPAADSFPGGGHHAGHHGGTPPHSRQGSPEVSPSPPHPQTPSRPTRGCRAAGSRRVARNTTPSQDLARRGTAAGSVGLVLAVLLVALSLGLSSFAAAVGIAALAVREGLETWNNND
jgi:hypothetical protein